MVKVTSVYCTESAVAWVQFWSHGLDRNTMYMQKVISGGFTYEGFTCLRDITCSICLGIKSLLGVYSTTVLRANNMPVML